MPIARHLMCFAAAAVLMSVTPAPAAALQAEATPVPADATPAPPTDMEEVQATVDKWVGDFNRGDFKSFIDACGKSAAIIDGFPPYAWSSCADWMAAYDANNKAISAAQGRLAIGAPAYSEVSFDRAYVIYPATFTDTQKGKPVTYKGSWTMTLRKMLDGWTVTGSASAWGENSLDKAATP